MGPAVAPPVMIRVNCPMGSRTRQDNRRGSLRRLVHQGLREDKTACEIVREREKDARYIGRATTYPDAYGVPSLTARITAGT